MKNITFKYDGLKSYLVCIFDTFERFNAFEYYIILEWKKKLLLINDDWTNDGSDRKDFPDDCRGHHDAQDTTRKWKLDIIAEYYISAQRSSVYYDGWILSKKLNKNYELNTSEWKVETASCYECENPKVH